MSAFNATRSLLRAPVVARQSALAGPRLAVLQTRSIGIQPRQPMNEGHPLPDSTPQNGPGGAERILGGIGVAVLILGGWTWFRSAQLKRERTGQTVTGNDPTKGPKQNQPSSVAG